MRKTLFMCVAAIAAGIASAGEVAVIAHDPGYYTSLAGHAGRWLKGCGIPVEPVAVKSMSSALAGAKIALLVGFDKPTAAELGALKAFRRRGGKLVVFYSSSRELAALMDVKLLGYATASYPGQWSRMDFRTKSPEGVPVSILQTSTVLHRAMPVEGRGRVMATWADRRGKSTGDAAWIATEGGFWMTHVLLADGDEDLKAQLLAALVGGVVPRLWNAHDHLTARSAERRALIELARAQSPGIGEIRAVWDHSGCGLYPGDWPKTMRMLREHGVTDLFVNVAGAAFAHYASNVLPRSKTFREEGDQLKACLDAARGTGIRVHVWILCFNATRGTPDRLEDFRKKGWRLKTPDGTLTEYLDPSSAGVRTHVLNAVDEILKNYRVDGIHLDFVRWYERGVRPADATEYVSRFVSEARRHVRRPVWLTAAVLGKYPSCIASVGQDWESWLDAGLVDYAVPMDYTEDNARFESYVSQHGSTPSRARRTIAGIGVTANESRLDAKKVIEQVKIARRHGLAGVALFDLDVMLERCILPYLRLGLWRKP